MPRSRLCLLTAAVALLGLIAAPRPAAAQASRDTSRVVAIGGAVTETLFALGLGDRVVAVDTSSTYPPEALASRPNVGYIRALSPEGVLSVGPSLIIAQDGAGPPDAVSVLKAASIPVVTIPEARDPAAVSANIRRIAEVMGAAAKGEELAGAVERDFAALAAMRERIAQPRSAAFVLSASGSAPVVGGAGTSADAMFRLAGLGNAMAKVSGYKPAVDEAILGADPYAIILMKDRNHALSDEALRAMPAFAGTRAASEGRLLRVDGGTLLSFGPRTPQAARDLAALVYPELGLPPLPAHPWTGGAGQ